MLALRIIVTAFAVVSIVQLSFWSETQSAEKLVRVQVLFKSNPKSQDLARFRSETGVKAIKPFGPYQRSPFFSRLFTAKVYPEKIKRLGSHVLVEGIHVPQRIEPSAIYPAKQPSTGLDDIFSPFQWALDNVYVSGDEKIIDLPEFAQGHLLLSEQNDLNTQFISSKPVDGGQETYSLGLGPRAYELARLYDGMSENKETVTVAVIDSGVDYNHKDLKPNIRLNTEECVRHPIYGLTVGAASADKDGNGFSGDCLGWNFTVDDKHPSRNKPKDVLSHGTHVAGIIAAVRNNQYGVAGLSDRIRIMPLKVIGVSKEEIDQAPDRPGNTFGFTDMVANAIMYATKNGADVINLSLGWPRIADLDIIRVAIEEARSKGITIVAAAGNNGHPSQIMPCAIDGVICVGSINNNGVVSSFSNYGGHVDLLAPGLGILSTFPDDPRLEPEIFNSGPFEIKQGTSQAAPYVSAAVALLKLDHKEKSDSRLKEHEILGRLLSTARPTYRKSTSGKIIPNYQSQAGALQIESMLTHSPVAVPYPALKETSLVAITTNKLKGQMSIPIRSLWRGSTNVKLSVRSLNPEINVTFSETLLGDIGAGEEKLVKLSFVANNLYSDSFVPLEMEVTNDELGTRKIWHQVTLSRQLKDEEMLSYPIAELPKSSLGLRHVKTIRGEEPAPVFYQVITEREEARISVLIRDGHHLKQLQEVVIPDLHRRFPKQSGPQESLYTLDLNDDGKFDYLLISQIQDAEENNFFQLSYLNHNLQPMYGESSHIRLSGSEIVPKWGALNFVKLQVKDLGMIKVPIFKSVAVRPEEDKPGAFSFPSDREVVEGVFVLYPRKQNHQFYFKPRWIDNDQFQWNLSQRLGIRNGVDRNIIIDVLPQTSAEFKAGRVTLLYQFGDIGSHRAAYVRFGADAVFSRNNFQVEMVKQKIDLRRVQILPVTNISGRVVHKNRSISVYRVDYRGKFISHFMKDKDPTEIEEVIKYISPDKGNLIVGPQASYSNENSVVSFFQKRKSIYALRKLTSSKQQVYSKDVIRSTFLPGFFLTELFYPTVVKTGRGFDPAMFVDSTAIQSSNIMLWQLSESEAKVPLKQNVMIPDNCLTVDQAKISADGTMAAALHCQDIETGQNFLKLYPFIN